MTKSDRLKVPVAADIRPGLIVSGDAVELRVLVINLVKNAQEAVLSAPEPAQASGGRPYGLFITLDAADEGTAVRLTVANTGALLTPEALAEIGRPLASSKSSGLGLMICKSIAEAHLATLAFSARTARDGGGLAVTLTMPARSEAPLHENYGNLP
ncbi:MAG: ATP-binding protein [Sutterella wadsworthensis]